MTQKLASVFDLLHRKERVSGGERGNIGQETSEFFSSGRFSELGVRCGGHVRVKQS